MVLPGSPSPRDCAAAALHHGTGGHAVHLGQELQQARLEQKCSAKPKAWLDWPAVLTARARAVSQYELRKEEGGPGARTRG